MEFNRDFEGFTAAMDNACMDIGKDPMALERRTSLFNRYAGYDLMTMANVISVAAADPQSGFNGITPAIINKHLGVKALVDLEWSDILVLAKTKDCPLGVLASLYIGSFELKENTDLENSVAAKAFIHELPKTAAKLNSGHSH